MNNIIYPITQTGVYTVTVTDGTYESSQSNPIVFKKWLKINNSYVGKINNAFVNSFNGVLVSSGKLGTWEDPTQEGSNLTVTQTYSAVQSGNELTIQ